MPNTTIQRRPLTITFILIITSLLILFVLDLYKPQTVSAATSQAAQSGGYEPITNATSPTNLIRWDKTTVSYSIENCPRSMDCAEAHNIIRQAVEAWDAVSGIDLVETTGVGDISIMWAAGQGGYPYPFDGQGGRLAHGLQPIPEIGAWAGDIHFDDDETWTAGWPTLPYPQQVSLYPVALHELGHALGLNHSTDPNAIMYAYYNPGRVMTNDDIIAIQSLYGAPEGSSALSTAPSAPQTVSAAPLSLRIPEITASPIVPLRMYSGPGISYAQSGSLLATSSARLLGKSISGAWFYVENSNQRGWVAGWLCVTRGTVPHQIIIQ